MINQLARSQRAVLGSRVLISLLGLLFVGLLARNLWIVFPHSTSTGDASIQAWYGPSAARYVYVAIAFLIAVAVSATAWFGMTAESRPAWVIGSAAGVVAGLLLGGLYLVADATAVTVKQMDPPFPITLCVGFGAPAVAGFLAGRRAGSVPPGAVAGFWAGLVSSLVLIVIAIGGLQLYAGRLESGPWLTEVRLGYVPGCPGATGPKLGACQSGDIVGGLANGLLHAPGIGMVLGGMAAALATARNSTLSAAWTRPILAAMVLALGFLALGEIELRLNLW
jgi:hypothetical protein